LQANTEAEELSRSAFTDPLTKCVAAFDNLVEQDQQTFLRDHGLVSDSAAKCLSADEPDDIIATIHHLMSDLTSEQQATVLGGLTAELPLHARMSALDAALASHERDAHGALGQRLGSAFVGTHPSRRKPLFDALASSLDVATHEILTESLDAATEAKLEKYSLG